MVNATIVFCDIVGFSRNDDAFQGSLLLGLNAEITHQLFDRLSTVEPSVIFLPTGDGVAIALEDLEQGSTGAVRKAEVFGLVDRLMQFAVRQRPKDGECHLRIGVHQGAVSVIRDINRRRNVCGHAINDCQRIMDAAHPNQVLFSSEAYRTFVGDSLGEYTGKPFDASAPARFSEPQAITGKHGVKLEVRVMYREGQPGWTRTEPYPREMIVGKEGRTGFIIRRFREILRDTETAVTLYEQSSFSTFGIPSKRDDDETTSPHYHALLLEQRQLLLEIARRPNAKLLLLLRPLASPKLPSRAARCDALGSALDEFKDNPNVRYYLAEDYDSPNRLVVSGHFCLEGYKLHARSGYDLSFIKTSKSDIESASSVFHRVEEREQHRQNKADVIESIKAFKHAPANVRPLLNQTSRSPARKTMPS